MRQNRRIRIPKLIEKLLTERMTTIPEPWRYKIIGTAGMGYDTAYSAHSTWNKIKEWAEKNGSEAILIKDRYREITQQSRKEIQEFRERKGYYQNGMNKRLQRGQSQGYLIVEITDPASQVIDLLIEEVKGKKII